MKKLKIASALAITTFLSGCTTITPIFSKTGDFEAETRPSDCKIKAYTTQPKKQFEELGVIDIAVHCPWGCPLEVKTASGVVDLVREDVCSVGGDAILLWEANGFGWYTKATVIKVDS